VPNNDFSKSEMIKLLTTSHMPIGLLQRKDYPEFAAAYRAQSTDQMAKAAFAGSGIENKFSANISAPMRIVLAGAAGGKVRFTATILARARKIVFKTDSSRLNKKALSISSLAAIVRDTKLIPLGALEEAIRTGQRTEVVAENPRAVEQSARMI
jgi:Pyruvate/2-oxoacid:ferredoxin oxidoreductase gamma subunit